MFGYATAETDVLMPAPITYAHRLMRRHAEVRRAGIDFLRPDAKSQLSFQYDADGVPIAVDAIVVSTHHSPSVDNPTLHEAVMEEIIKPVVPGNWITADTKTFINPAGRFETGGPIADCGLTGRKIIVDTYGGMARHGGGAFSGKDPSKVDRSAAYAGRYVAKNIVAAGTRQALRTPGQLCHRHRGAHLRQRQYLRHGHHFRGADRSTDPCMFRFEAPGAHRHAGSQTTDLSCHRRVRTLRSRGRHLYLGENGQGRGTARSRERFVGHALVASLNGGQGAAGDHKGRAGDHKGRPYGTTARARSRHLAPDRLAVDSTCRRSASSSFPRRLHGEGPTWCARPMCWRVFDPPSTR